MDYSKPGTFPHVRDTTDSEVKNAIPTKTNKFKDAGLIKTCCMKMAQSKNPKNLRTALILFSVALVFFFGVIAKRVWNF